MNTDTTYTMLSDCNQLTITEAAALVNRKRSKIYRAVKKRTLKALYGPPPKDPSEPFTARPWPRFILQKEDVLAWANR